MSQTVHHYFVFETAGGFCGIAWNQRRHHALPAADRQRRGDRADFCCAGCPAPHRARPRRRWPRRSPPCSAISRASRPIFPASRSISASRTPSSAGLCGGAAGGLGRTTTYGALAKEFGAGPEAARDVGQAMAKNPVALIIPCHRVLAAGGKVGGFSAPGGAAKLRMLALEGIHLEPPPPAQRSVRVLGLRGSESKQRPAALELRQKGERAPRRRRASSRARH